MRTQCPLLPTLDTHLSRQDWGRVATNTSFLLNPPYEVLNSDLQAVPAKSSMRFHLHGRTCSCPPTACDTLRRNKAFASASNCSYCYSGG
eukprot:6130109-Amphidinium_carterae.1